MTNNPQVFLKTKAILNVPFETYDKDFTFIVNEEEFKTSRLISDLISPKISRIHQIDPTIDTMNIHTTERGNFEYILRLATFSEITIPKTEISFFSEVIETLGNDNICISKIKDIEFTNENAVSELHKHERYSQFYSEYIDKGIEYVSSHFYELIEKSNEEMKSLSFNTLERIISNHNLKLTNEDQLVKFINELCIEKKNSNDKNQQEYSNLYGYVIFANVERSTIDEFIETFEVEYMNKEIWSAISERLRRTVFEGQEKEETEKVTRYTICPQKFEEFEPNGDSNFNGILKHFVDETNGNIEERVNMTASSNSSNCKYMIQFDNDFCYQSSNSQNSWVCFDFKEKRVIPTNYQIKTHSYGQSSYNPRSWIIEGSNDNSNWEQISEERDSQYLNGSHLSHVFPITKGNKEFRYIKMTQIGPNWSGRYYYLTIQCFEIYGKLI